MVLHQLIISPRCQVFNTDILHNKDNTNEDLITNLPMDILAQIFILEKDPVQAIKNFWSLRRTCVYLHKLSHEDPVMDVINKVWIGLRAGCHTMTVDLSNCDLQRFPSYWMRLPISNLILNQNQIAQVPDLDSEYNLEVLEMRDNQLSALDFRLPSNLHLLDVSNNQITKIEEDFLNSTYYAVFGGSGSKPSLEVWLSNNQISDVSGNLLSKTIALESLRFDHNPLLCLYEDIELEPLNSKEKLLSFQRHVNDFKNYKCISHFAKYIQILSSGTCLQGSFYELVEKNLICEMVSEIKGSNEEVDEFKVFEDLPTFHAAVRKSIATKFNRLSQEEKNRVFGWVYELAGSPITKDRQWGEHNAFDHVLRLVDAMACIEFSPEEEMDFKKKLRSCAIMDSTSLRLKF